MILLELIPEKVPSDVSRINEELFRVLLLKNTLLEKKPDNVPKINEIPN